MQCARVDADDINELASIALSPQLALSLKPILADNGPTFGILLEQVLPVRRSLDPSLDDVGACACIQ